MIAALIDWLLYGPEVEVKVNFDNPHTVEKIAIGQARANADLWSLCSPARRMTAIERKQREQPRPERARVLRMGGRG